MGLKKSYSWYYTQAGVLRKMGREMHKNIEVSTVS